MIKEVQGVCCAEASIAVVSKLFHYPVKSMQGEEREVLHFDYRGCLGDRLFAIQDTNGKLGSGKNTRRFRQIDGLLAFQAVSDGESLEVHFPDGTTMTGDDPKIHDRLSESLGTEVTLARENTVPHFDAGAVHIICSSELSKLGALIPDACCDERRFRPNIVLSPTGTKCTIGEWRGKIVRIGDDVKLKITASTERCRMIAIQQTGLRAEPEILKVVAQELELNFGVYAKVLQTGSISVGDEIVIDESSARAT